MISLQIASQSLCFIWLPKNCLHNLKNFYEELKHGELTVLKHKPKHTLSPNFAGKNKWHSKVVYRPILDNK